MNHTVRSPARESATATRTAGLALAGITAVVSGISVFVNGYGVAHFDDATTYTTAKNLVAALVIVTLLARSSPSPASRVEAPQRSVTTPTTPRARRVATLVAIAVIGGSLPFVLFFEGFARASSTDAAFIHKTMVVWVALAAAVVLRERVGPPHVAAIALILVGYVQLAGGVGLPELGTGELLILVATLCWSVEVVLARSLLVDGVAPTAVSTARMAGGVLLLLGWAVARGALDDLFGLTFVQWRWVALTGILLAAYVVSWHHALARAGAVDVTAVLSLGAVLTAVLDAGVRGATVEPIGLALLLVGGLLAAGAAATTARRSASA
jgi:drug/metabolite transporter (DMT)-like permease